MQRMIRIAILGVATLLASQTATAAKSCEELKQEIAAKIEANGVQNYTLEIVPTTRSTAAKWSAAAAAGR